jgi:hypothetical protein
MNMNLIRHLLSRASINLAHLVARIDGRRFDKFTETPNGAARLIAFHDAVLDADDTLEAVDKSICEGDLAQASRLIALGRESPG